MAGPAEDDLLRELSGSMYSVVIPVYMNAEGIDALFEGLETLRQRLPQPLEVVFVVDGSPDDSFERLRSRLPQAEFAYQLLLLSRNFGSFSAIRAGLEACLSRNPSRSAGF